ncbi:MAG: hypothetical protein IT370_13730 [Deltaproteobacteria bacterium]|nr:hypothetical protein [Deltaproteobacteria bacterium]
MRIPAWVTLLMGVAIIGFGIFRISLARKPGKRPTYLGSKSADLIMGVVHVLAGLFLIGLGSGLIRRLMGG